MSPANSSLPSPMILTKKKKILPCATHWMQAEYCATPKKKNVPAPQRLNLLNKKVILLVLLKHMVISTTAPILKLQ